MSSGHEEWKHILGSWSVWIFHIMYLIVSKNSNVIVCHERLFKKEKSYQVHPSRLDSKWFTDYKEISTDKVKLLYVGRINPEKGIYDFLKMYDQIKIKTEFSIAGYSKNLKINNNKVKLLGYVSEPQSLIDVYDSHNIMILPSFTEAHPYVVDECLSRYSEEFVCFLAYMMCLLIMLWFLFLVCTLSSIRLHRVVNTNTRMWGTFQRKRAIFGGRTEQQGTPYPYRT